MTSLCSLPCGKTAIIGAMKAIGGTRGVIMRGYLLSVGLYSLLATLPGLALGIRGGYALAAALAPDVVLMDLVMPDMDGVEATRLLKQRSPRSQVIVLTSYHEDEQIFPAIRAGALSYLLKGVGLDALTDAVHKAARGEAVLHPHVAARIVKELHGVARDTALLYDTLSTREREVLRLIAEGLHNDEIAARLVISERTVEEPHPQYPE